MIKKKNNLETHQIWDTQSTALQMPFVKSLQLLYPSITEVNYVSSKVYISIHGNKRRRKSFSSHQLLKLGEYVTYVTFHHYLKKRVNKQVHWPFIANGVHDFIVIKIKKIFKTISKLLQQWSLEQAYPKQSQSMNCSVKW